MITNKSMLDVAQEAFYLIRQDISLPSVEEAANDTSMEWEKCRRALEFAVSEVLSAHDWYFAREDDESKEDLSLWPVNIRKLLVYALARELSVQIAGRTEDLKTLHALYTAMLAEARIKDLSEEKVEDGLEREVVSAVVGVFSSEDKALPRSIKYITDKIAALKPLAMKEVLASHPWGFALDEDFTPSCPLTFSGLGAFVHSLTTPSNMIKLVGVYGEDGESLNWRMVAGEIRADSPIKRILFVRNLCSLCDFSPDARKLVVLRLAADIVKSIGNISAAELGEKLYRDQLETAKLNDTRETKPSEDDVWGENHYVEVMSGRRHFDGRRR